MDRGQILAMLTAAGVDFDARRDRELSLSSNLIRVRDARPVLPGSARGAAALFVPGHLDLEAQVCAYVDAIHWIRGLDLGDRASLVLGRSERIRADSTATVIAAPEGEP